MKKIFKTGFLFILCAFLLVGCSFDISGINNAIDAVKATNLSGALETKTFIPSDGFAAKKLDFENISFTNTKNAKIYINYINRGKIWLKKKNWKKTDARVY